MCSTMNDDPQCYFCRRIEKSSRSSLEYIALFSRPAATENPSKSLQFGGFMPPMSGEIGDAVFVWVCCIKVILGMFFLCLIRSFWVGAVMTFVSCTAIWPLLCSRVIWQVGDVYAQIGPSRTILHEEVQERNHISWHLVLVLSCHCPFCSYHWNLKVVNLLSPSTFGSIHFGSISEGTGYLG